MGQAEPKQFLLLHKKSVIWHTVKKFIEAYDDIEIIIVLPADWIEKGKALLKDLKSATELKFCGGGETRFHSVRAGLQFVKEDSIVFIHDAVRCLVNNSLIQRCYQHAMENGSAIPVTDAKDSIRLIETNGSRSIDRHLVKLVQTPQTFKSNIILSAYQQPYQEGFTDEAMVVESLGQTVSLVEGDPRNIKITLPSDLIVASQLLSEQ
jgi:2-C-methyl-D-erythritol 4-phosphate cytidylyltransferase